MNILIETKALKTFLYGILSCKCPVTEETEKSLFSHFFNMADRETMDFCPVLSIACENPERTPIHNLFDLCTFSRENPREFTITMNDVLRYLGSVIHYNMVVSNHHGIEFSNPGLLISHLLIPVRLEKLNKGFEAVYEKGENRIRFASVLVPVRVAEDCSYYAIHMGVMLNSLTKQQADMLHAHQQMIPGFLEAAGRINTVDFRDLPPYGDHTSQVLERFRRNQEKVFF